MMPELARWALTTSERLSRALNVLARLGKPGAVHLLERFDVEGDADRLAGLAAMLSVATGRRRLACSDSRRPRGDSR